MCTRVKVAFERLACRLRVTILRSRAPHCCRSVLVKGWVVETWRSSGYISTRADVMTSGILFSWVVILT